MKPETFLLKYATLNKLRELYSRVFYTGPHDKEIIYTYTGSKVKDRTKPYKINKMILFNAIKIKESEKINKLEAIEKL